MPCGATAAAKRRGPGADATSKRSNARCRPRNGATATLMTSQRTGGEVLSRRRSRGGGKGMTKKLVVLGAGIGGLSVIKELAESGVSLDDLDITVVDEDFTHFLGFTLPWVMRGWRDPDSVPIRPSVTGLAGVRPVTGTVRAIDPAAHTVTLVEGTDIAFDALVIATGARNAIDNIPGLRDAVHQRVAVHYYSADAAAQAHEALRAFTGGRLVFLVTSQPYRCPVAPYEGALLAADLLCDNGSRAEAEISVYSPEKQPMPSAGPYAGPELVAL